MHRMRATTKRKPPAAIPGTRCTGRRRSGLKRRVRERSGAPVGRSVHSVHDEPRGPPATPLRCAPSARRRCAWCPRHARPGRRTGDDRAKRWYIESMSERYDPSTIEPNWQQYWDEHETFRAERHPGKPKAYVLDMFPYPSGAGLHVGHPEGYTATDIVARYKRMRGFDVLHPMGWDAFGLPAEQHAIKTGTHPRDDHAQEHRDLPAPAQDARLQLRLGARGRHDRSRLRQVDAVDLPPALQARARVPGGDAGQLVPGARHRARERRGHRRQERARRAPGRALPLRQWMLRITEYADRLDEGLAKLDWPDTKAKQHNWIGRSEGADVDFAVEGHADASHRGLHDARRHAPRRDLRRARARAPARRRRSSAPRSSEAVARRTSTAAKSKSDIDRSDVTKTKTGVAARRVRGQPDQRRQGPGLGRRLRHRHLRHWRGHGRARHTTSAITRSPRTYELPIVAGRRAG